MRSAKCQVNVYATGLLSHPFFASDWVEDISHIHRFPIAEAAAKSPLCLVNGTAINEGGLGSFQ